ncbi:MAG TPA: ATP-binding protein [Thermoleophilaceae bacterium]|nr:ATP-binding protein [Thermoleophilaceae bacterium]
MARPDSDASLEELVREHAAVRRVATLVAQEPSPAQVFEAVAREVGTLLGARRAQLVRVASPEEGIVAASWSDGTLQPVPVGHRAPLDGSGVLGQMMRDPRPVRIEDWDEIGGGVAALMRSLGIRSGAAGPIIIGGRLWGAVAAVWSDAAEMPVGAEDRVAAFAELVAYAIENAEARDEIAASRARLVEAADEARRRIERDLQHGAQQRLVAAALELTMLDSQFDRDPAAARAALARAREQLDGGLGELRDLARGIHPSVLTDRGLAVALEGLVKRAPMAVELRMDIPERLDPAIEAAGYFLVSEAITNAAKHAQADTVTVEVVVTGDTVLISVTDDGVGGAETGRGSGLGGLRDRVEAVGGRLEITSPPSEGTRLQARLPTRVLGSLNGH